MKDFTTILVFADIVSAQSMTMLAHSKLFYFGKIKTNNKSNQKFILIFSKIVFPCIVVDYADNMLAQSLTKWTHAEIVIDCAAIMSALHGHDVIDQADILSAQSVLLTTQTISENFEGFSRFLKEQSGEKGNWVCLYWTLYTVQCTPNRNNLKYENPLI